MNIRRLWIKVLIVLLAVSAIAMSSALIVRELMIKDFEGYLEGEVEDRAYWITASLESTFEKYGVWANPEIIENTIWALMLGFDMKLYDENGAFVIDTESAVNTLSPLVRKRITAISDLRTRESGIEYRPYSLFLAGKEIGRVNLKFLRSKKEMVFESRSRTLLIFSVAVLGCIVVVLSVIFSKKLTEPVYELTEAVSAVAKGNLKSRVKMSGNDEISRLSSAFNRMASALEIQESLRKKLTSNIAHELRTPISAIRGELEGMIDGLIPISRENILSLHEETGRLKKIIEGLEDLATAEASSLYLNRQQIELKSFLQNVSGRYIKQMQDKGIHFDLFCKEGLLINADPDRLSQIVINLLSNSIRATSSGGRITISAEIKGNDIEIVIADTGHGIKQEDMPFIFERFYRGSKGGLGLGLAIAKELAEAHEGSVKVESEYGKGAKFTVRLPDK